MKLEEQDVDDKGFARLIGIMVEAELLSFEHYIPWADAKIAELDAPPPWLLDLASTKYRPDALAAIHRYAFSPPFQDFDRQDGVDRFISCHFLRYARGEISWASFLKEAGSVSDCRGGDLDCSFFYVRLTALEHDEYSTSTEERQRIDVEQQFGETIETMRSLYSGFTSHFRQYVTEQAGNKPEFGP